MSDLKLVEVKLKLYRVVSHLSTVVDRLLSAEARVEALEAQVRALTAPAPAPVEPAPGPCKVVEYDGAYKCLTHNREWGAVAGAGDPCPEWGGKPGLPAPPAQRCRRCGYQFAILVAGSSPTPPGVCPACAKKAPDPAPPAEPAPERWGCKIVETEPGKWKAVSPCGRYQARGRLWVPTSGNIDLWFGGAAYARDSLAAIDHPPPGWVEVGPTDQEVRAEAERYADRCAFLLGTTKWFAACNGYAAGARREARKEGV